MPDESTEVKVARIEVHQAHIQEDIAELKGDVKSLQQDVGKLSIGLVSVPQKVVDLLQAARSNPGNKRWQKPAAGAGGGLAAVGVVIAAIGKALGWW